MGTPPSAFCYIVSNRPDLMPAQQQDVTEMKGELAEIKRYLMGDAGSTPMLRPEMRTEPLLVPTQAATSLSTRQKFRLVSVLLAGALAGGLVASALIPSGLAVPSRLLCFALAMPAFGTALAALLALLEGGAYDEAANTEVN